MSKQISNARRYPSAIGSNGASLIVSQGATVEVDWECVLYGTTTPCPAGYSSSWSSGRVPSGFASNFSPTTTSAGGIAAEFFTASSGTPPGLYTLNACIATSYDGSPLDSVCESFQIAVISSTATPPPMPSAPSSSETVKLLIGPANSSSGGKTIPIPATGHLYVAILTNGVQLYPLLQAGPTKATGGLLAIQNYSQNVYNDPGKDITAYASVNSVLTAYARYSYWQSANNLPGYDAIVQNSNTWVDALLLANGMSQNTLNSLINDLQNTSGKHAVAYGNGSVVEPCFIPGGRIGFIVQPTGCTVLPY